MEFRNLDLASLGEIHFGRKQQQPTREQLRAFHRMAEGQLARRVLWFEGPKRTVIAEAIAEVIHEQRLTCYACAVLPNHVHVLIRRHRIRPGEIERYLKNATREQLVGTDGTQGNHPVWSKDGARFHKNSVESM